jgi:hypothetical protein
MPKTDITVRELVEKVQRGELKLPEMQRRYVWPATRVRDLMDSLYRGYPSGTILVWETDDDIETRDLAIAPTRAPTTTGKLLLLDGQQRTTSLASILSGQPVTVRNRRKPIDILFNLDHPAGPPVEAMEVDEADYPVDIEEIEDEESAERDIQQELKKRTFVVASKSLKNDPSWVPVSDIFKMSDSQILRGLNINSDDERWDMYSERLQQVRKIQDYPYVMHVLEKNMSYVEVTEIFVRVNSLGIKLRGSDLAMAQITSKWKGFMQTIEDFAAQFGDEEEGILEAGLPVRALVVFATHQSRYKTVGKLSLEQMKKAWEQAKEALEFAINFAHSNAGIQSIDFLSAPTLLVTVGVYAVLKGGRLTEEETKMLLRWFYIAHLRAHYTVASSESVLDSDLSLLFKGRDLKALLDQLQLHVKKFDLDPEEVKGKGIRSPIFSMLYIILKQQGAKDWLSGLELDKHVGKTHAIQYHHIFPKALLKRAGYEPKEINQIANMAFIGGKTNRNILDKEPIEYMEKMVIPKQGESAVVSQLIPADRSLWKLDSYNRFLDYRTKAIADTINGFLQKLS